MTSSAFLSIFLLTLLSTEIFANVNEENCEVPSDEKSDHLKIQKYFKEECKSTKGKDNSLCYYIGGLETSATNIMKEMSQPLSWSMPAEKVCEKLKKFDSQICELKYEKTIDLKTINFKKIKVKELKKILDVWGESCKGCTEKNEYISLVKEKMKIYDPEAHTHLSAKDEL